MISSSLLSFLTALIIDQGPTSIINKVRAKSEDEESVTVVVEVQSKGFPEADEFSDLLPKPTHDDDV